MIVWLLTVLLGLLPIIASQADASPGPIFRRGINIHHAMNWAEVDPSNRDRYLVAPFQNPARKPTAAELNRLHEAGFDFIRLTVDPGPFLQFVGKDRDDLDQMLISNVKAALDANLAIIIDFHPNRQVKAYSPIEFVGVPDAPMIEAFSRVIQRTARLLAGIRSKRVALELLNEPALPKGPVMASWQDTLEKYHAAARKGSEDILLVLGGADANSSHGLISLDPSAFKNSNVMYTFHCYTPLAFTHQGDRLEKTEALRNVPYPLGDGPTQHTRDSMRSHSLRLYSDPAKQEAAFLAGWDYLTQVFRRGPAANNPAVDFEIITKWADSHRIPRNSILLGEFGVTRDVGRSFGAPEDDRLRWIKDVRLKAEEGGFPWAVWAYKLPTGMALINIPGSGELDPRTLTALGLSP